MSLYSIIQINLHSPSNPRSQNSKYKFQIMIWFRLAQSYVTLYFTLIVHECYSMNDPIFNKSASTWMLYLRQYCKHQGYVSVVWYILNISALILWFGVRFCMSTHVLVCIISLSTASTCLHTHLLIYHTTHFDLWSDTPVSCILTSCTHMLVPIWIPVWCIFGCYFSGSKPNICIHTCLFVVCTY